MIAREACRVAIFYSNDDDLSEEYKVLEWSLINDHCAIQDNGKRAREFLSREDVKKFLKRREDD